MKEIIVNTQAELDAVPKDFDGVIEIYGGTPSNPIVVKSDYDSATVWARGSATVCACDFATVEARGSATVWAYDSVTVWAYGSATVKACNSAAVKAFDSATVWAHDSATVRAYHSATVRARDSATVDAYGFAQIVKLSDCAKIELKEQARCIAPTEDLDVFCTYHSIQRNGDKSAWYKAVHKRGSRYIADYDEKTTYTIGKTKTVKYLDTNRKKECGCGIHIAPLRWAVEFGKDWNDLAILEVEAVTADIVLPYESDGKVRVGKIKVLREVPLEECGLLGKMIAKRNKKESEG